MDKIVDSIHRRISRRTALKGIGAGAAVAWAAPSMMSINAASAASPATQCGCPSSGNATCQNPVIGLECPDATQNFSCFCWERVGGGRVCGSFASNSTCNSDAECPTGQACVICSTDSDCGCSETGRACAPPCVDCVAPAGAAGATSNPPIR